MILKYVIVSLLVMFDIVHDIELFSSIVIDDVKNCQYELLVDTDGRRRWLLPGTNLLVLFFSGYIASGIVLLFLSIQMDEGVGFVQRRTCNET